MSCEDAKGYLEARLSEIHSTKSLAFPDVSRPLFGSMNDVPSNHSDRLSVKTLALLAQIISVPKVHEDHLSEQMAYG